MAEPDTSHISFTYPPVASMWVVTLYYLLCTRTNPYPVSPPFYWLRLFSSQNFSLMNTPAFSNLVIPHLPAYEDGTDRVFRNVRI
jgi:hypothetical protein